MFDDEKVEQWFIPAVYFSIHTCQPPTYSTNAVHARYDILFQTIIEQQKQENNDWNFKYQIMRNVV